MREKTEEKEKTTYTPSQCQNEEQTSVVRWDFYGRNYEKRVFLSICILLDFSVPPVWVSKVGSRVSRYQVPRIFFFVDPCPVYNFRYLDRVGGWGGVLIIKHGRSRMTIDPRIPRMLGQSTLGFHRPGRQCLQ